MSPYQATLPVPVFLVIFQQTGDVSSRNHLHAVDAAFMVDPMRLQIFAYGKGIDSALLELAKAYFLRTLKP